MNAIRILICSTDLLLGAVLTELMTAEEDIEVTGITTEASHQVIETVEALQPDAVIFTTPNGCRKMDTVHEVATSFPGTTLITLSPEDNWLRLFEGRKILLSQFTDLVQVIRSLKGDPVLQEDEESTLL